MASRRAGRGFTLVEALVGVLLTVVVGWTLSSVLTSSAMLSQSLDTSAVVQAEARRALMAMERDLQQTGLNRVTIPAPPHLSGEPPTSIRFQLPVDMDGDGLVTNASGNVEWDPANPATFVTYSLNGSNQLIRSQPGQADRVLADNIQAVAFSIVVYPNTPVNDQNDDLIAVDLTAQRAATLLPAAPTMALRATIRPRNTNK